MDFTYFLSRKERSENAGANENLSCGFPSIPGIAPGVAPRIVVLVLLKSWDAIPRMEFRIPRMELRIPRVAPRIPRNSPRAPRMACSRRERFSWNWGGPQASEFYSPRQKRRFWSLRLWSRRPPNSRETQKASKWPKHDSKVTPGVPPQSDPKWLKSDSKMTQKWVRSHFWVTFGSLWGRSGRVTFESLLGHFGVGLAESLLSHFWVTLMLSVFL